MPKRLYRYEAPNKYDHAPQGTEIVRLYSTLLGTAELYKQISQDPENPHWQSVGLIQKNNLIAPDAIDHMDTPKKG